MWSGNEYIAHYTRIEVLLEYLLPNIKIRFSPLNKLNDPKESKNKNSLMLFQGLPDDPWAQPIRYDELFEEHNRAISVGIKVACFSLGTDKIPCWRKPRMWAQYAGNFRGACLIFNKNKFLNSIKNLREFVIANQVFYDDESAESLCPFMNISCPQGEFDTFEYVKSELLKYPDRFLFCKNTDWFSEDEYRFVCYDNSNSEYIYYDASQALEGIVIGDEVSTAYFKMLIELSPVDVYKLSWDSNFQKYELQILNELI